METEECAERRRERKSASWQRKITETLEALDDSRHSTFVGNLVVGCDVYVRCYSRGGYYGVLQGFIFDDEGKCSFVAVKDKAGDVWREELSMVEAE